jgi:wobble nucleotide-excising tRNase
MVMAIEKIEKLNHARYRNFNWSTSVQPFCSGVNILFGWNGSGKTTLSRIFHKIETGAKIEGCSFKIKTDTSSFSETDTLDELRSNIRVFNEDYIQNTLKGDSKIPYIFFAGKEAVSYADEEKNLEEKRKDLTKIVIPITHDQIAKNTALLVKGITGINGYKKELTGGSHYATYDKSDFENRFKNIKKRIEAGEIKNYTDLVRTDIDALKIQLVNSDRVTKNNKDIANAAQWLLDNIEKTNALLESTPIQELSDRINLLPKEKVEWVRTGVSIHFNGTETHDKCLFCNSDIHNSYELLKHFSEDVVRATDEIDFLIRQIETHTTTLAKLESPTSEQTANANKLRSTFDQVVPVLREKRNAISAKKDLISIDSDVLNSFTTVIESDATTVAYAIESHFVAEQYDEYQKACDELKTITEKRDAMQVEINKLDEQVRTLKQKAKNTHESASRLNTLFKVVFPYRKIEITDSDDGAGYVLKRDGILCSFSSLSEGEKNFIALAYFIYSINDAQNKLSDNGIVLIDDPVSSLDKQAIFQIFSIIVNETKKNSSRQYLILTHSLDFLGHLKEFFGKAIGNGSVRLFSLSATNGGCSIGEIDPLLKDHRSDYYYTFSVLYRFKDVCSLEDSYLIVNLLRRWLETFLEFKFSTSGDLQSTITMAYNEASIITQKWNSPFNADPLVMYRFINHGSHGFPDTESTDESILNDANIRIQEAFQLVKLLDPMHSKKLEGLIRV